MKVKHRGNIQQLMAGWVQCKQLHFWVYNQYKPHRAQPSDKMTNLFLSTKLCMPPVRLELVIRSRRQYQCAGRHPNPVHSHGGLEKAVKEAGHVVD